MKKIFLSMGGIKKHCHPEPRAKRAGVRISFSRNAGAFCRLMLQPALHLSLRSLHPLTAFGVQDDNAGSSLRGDFNRRGNILNVITRRTNVRRGNLLGQVTRFLRLPQSLRSLAMTIQPLTLALILSLFTITESWAYTTYKYDAYGNQTERYDCDTNNGECTFKGRTENFYDENGNLIAKRTCAPSAIDSTTGNCSTYGLVDYIYDEEGNRTYRKDCKSGYVDYTTGKCSYYQSADNFTYDENKNITSKKNCADSKGASYSIDPFSGNCKSNGYSSKFEYTYDANGRLASYIRCMSTNSVTGKCETYAEGYDVTYDENGNVAANKYCASRDINGLCTSYSHAHEYRYDEKGNMIADLQCGSNGLINEENGNCISYGDGKYYEYDQNGNKMIYKLCDVWSFNETTGECNNDHYYLKEEYKYSDDYLACTNRQDGKCTTCGDGYTLDNAAGICVEDCGDGYKAESGVCVAKTCAEMYEGSSETQCENSVSGCSVTTCTEVGTLVDGETKCYTSATVDYTPTCDSNASVVGEGASCSCECNSGYSGDGTTCEMLTCEDLGKLSSCSESVNGCTKTVCVEDGSVADGSKCYKTEQQNTAPQCGAHAQLIEDADTCACQCDEGYSGDGTNCALKTCAEISDGSSETCTPNTSGCVVTSCRAVASRADGTSCYVSETSDYTPENCGDGRSVVGEGSGCACVCDGGKVERGGKCIDPLETFAKKRYTPAEADQWLYDENNTVTLTFKK